MWKYTSLDQKSGWRKNSEANRILYCRIEFESVRRFKTIALSKSRSSSEYLREIVYEKLGELESGDRRTDTLKTEIDCLRRGFTSAINSLHKGLSLGSRLELWPWGIELVRNTSS